MAQSPMESTTRDFWKMIVERECRPYVARPKHPRTVVMLCGLEEDKNVHFTTAMIFIRPRRCKLSYYIIITGSMSSVLVGCLS